MTSIHVAEWTDLHKPTEVRKEMERNLRTGSVQPWVDYYE